MNKKRILITGAAGFIGFHMAKFFHQRGDFILGFDNFNDYYDPLLKRARANELEKLGIPIIEKDINDEQALYRAVDQNGITHFLHLAAQAGVRYSLENPQAYLHANMKGFLNVLEVCRAYPKMPLIYASSSSVYGLNQKTPFSVEDRTDNQASFYGVTKKSNELMAQTYHHLYGISTTGLRFFTVYGPWGRPDMAYFSFTRAILEKRPIDVYHQGHMFRDFTYIDDIVKGTAAAVDQSFPSALFNLGNNRPEELSHLIALLENELGVKAIKNFLPMQPGDVLSTFADIKESGEKLNFHPKISLKEGIAHFIHWYKEYYNV